MPSVIAFRYNIVSICVHELFYHLRYVLKSCILFLCGCSCGFCLGGGEGGGGVAAVSLVFLCSLQFLNDHLLL